MSDDNGITGEQTFWYGLAADTLFNYIRELEFEGANGPDLQWLKGLLEGGARWQNAVAPNGVRQVSGGEEYWNWESSAAGAPSNTTQPVFNHVNGNGDEVVYWNGKGLMVAMYAYAFAVTEDAAYKIMAENLLASIFPVSMTCEANQGCSFTDAFGDYFWSKSSAQTMKGVLPALALLENVDAVTMAFSSQCGTPQTGLDDSLQTRGDPSWYNIACNGGCNGQGCTGGGNGGVPTASPPVGNPTPAPAAVDCSTLTTCWACGVAWDTAAGDCQWCAGTQTCGDPYNTDWTCDSGACAGVDSSNEYPCEDNCNPPTSTTSLPTDSTMPADSTTTTATGNTITKAPTNTPMSTSSPTTSIAESSTTPTPPSSTTSSDGGAVASKGSFDILSPCALMVPLFLQFLYWTTSPC